DQVKAKVGQVNLEAGHVKRGTQIKAIIKEPDGYQKELKEKDTIEKHKEKDQQTKKYDPNNITIKGRKLQEQYIKTSDDC
ncbi:hypothetical protein NAI77_09615, partial [Francisella tularensis subsp. holarctica]|uniref:hypothetical protein n=1 Tax=Francisella tularensis TaxID=263 RepID=UPI0023AC1563|nr:hypothetical protein [Francisella tularensis subsp. holarctica]